MAKQKTIKESFTISGKGLHTGLSTSVTVKPATENSGIIVQRVNGTTKPQVKAVVDNIFDPALSGGRQTNLICGEHKVQTIEHLLSAFHAFGISNVLVEIDSDELPALDGSSLQYAEAITESGIVEQDAKQECLVIKEPVYVETAETSTVVLPYDGFRISYTLSYGNPALSDQFVMFDVTEETFLNELSPARTFCLKEEAELLQSKGFGKGASYENTLVFEDNQPVNNTLRFPDEAARHKVVDLIGDLYLLGCPLKGHIVTQKTGHAHNIALVQKLRTLIANNAESATDKYADIRSASQLDIHQIMRVLPHRYPFLLVDKIIELIPGKRAVGIKNISVNESVFLGHFPGHPIFPGVLIVEAMAQTGGIVTMMKEKHPEKKVAYFMSIDKVKFRAPVLPGDQLRMEIDVVRSKGPIGVCSCKSYVGEKLVCEGEIKFTTMDK